VVHDLVGEPKPLRRIMRWSSSKKHRREFSLRRLFQAVLTAGLGLLANRTQLERAKQDGADEHDRRANRQYVQSQG
jgi:hypothetical protein